MTPSILPDLNEEEWCRFLSEIAHKMKNKLGGIHGFSSLLEKDLEEEDPRRRLIMKAQEGILQLNALLILYMKIFTVVESQPEELDLVPLLSDAVSRFNGRAIPGVPSRAPVPAAPDRPVLASSDRDLLMEWMIQALTFVTGVSEKIETIQLERLGDERILIGIAYALPRKSLPCNHSERIADLILNSEPFETRLSLAIAARIGRILGGTMENRALSTLRRLMTLQLSKGR
jgi:signal transduction histidine kinase